jgi:hypothetical protein
MPLGRQLGAKPGLRPDFDAVQQVGLAAGLVDDKSCAIDEDWQALRLVFRKADRPA